MINVWSLSSAGTSSQMHLAKRVSERQFWKWWKGKKATKSKIIYKEICQWKVTEYIWFNPFSVTIMVTIYVSVSIRNSKCFCILKPVSMYRLIKKIPTDQVSVMPKLKPFICKAISEWVYKAGKIRKRWWEQCHTKYHQLLLHGFDAKNWEKTIK